MMNEPKEANLVMTGPRSVHEPQLLAKFLAIFIESQSHRTAQFGRDFERSSGPTCCGEGSLDEIV